MAWPLNRYLMGDYVPQLTKLILGAALFVLLIGCMNVKAGLDNGE